MISATGLDILGMLTSFAPWCSRSALYLHPLMCVSTDIMAAFRVYRMSTRALGIFVNLLKYSGSGVGRGVWNDCVFTDETPVDEKK